jgi:hypothetical protein
LNVSLASFTSFTCAACVALAFAGSAASAQVSGASQAVAQPAPGATVDATTAFDPPPSRRSGIVIGTSLGVGLAGASGYPNDSTKVDDPQYYAASGFMTGGGGSVFVMGALADYVSFGFWFGLQRYGNGDWSSTGGGGGFRVEAFPLFYAVPALKDLGVLTQLGIGKATLDPKRGDYPGAEGLQSFVGAGAFYEWSLFKMLGGHFAGGPSLEYDAIFSRSIDRHGALLGARLVFYGGK